MQYPLSTFFWVFNTWVRVPLDDKDFFRLRIVLFTALNVSARFLPPAHLVCTLPAPCTSLHAPLDLLNHPSIFPIFHISHFQNPTIHWKNDSLFPSRALVPPDPIIINSHEELFIDKIIDEHPRGKQTLYRAAGTSLFTVTSTSCTPMLHAQATALNSQPSSYLADVTGFDASRCVESVRSWGLPTHWIHADRLENDDDNEKLQPGPNFVKISSTKPTQFVDPNSRVS